MKNSPSAPVKATKIALSPELAAPSIALAGGFRHAWTTFWFSAVDAIGLHVLRFLAGLLFITWLLPLGGQMDALFSMEGWFDREAYREAAREAQLAAQAREQQDPQEAMRHADIPVPPWSLLYWIGTNSVMLRTFYWVAIAVFAIFALG